METFQDEEQCDQAILALFNVLNRLKICGQPNYAHYGLEWGKRQAYIYRLLSAADRN